MIYRSVKENHLVNAVADYCGSINTIRLVKKKKKSNVEKNEKKLMVGAM